MASTSNSKKNGKKVKVVTPELEAEAVGTPETRGATAFGLDAKDLLNKLHTDAEFNSTFMEQYAVVQDIVKQYKQDLKDKKDAERAQVQQEKDEAERSRLQVPQAVGQGLQD